MGKCYCDYCDVFLTHDSVSVRKQHNDGNRHRQNVCEYYRQFIGRATQEKIDEIVQAFELKVTQGLVRPTYGLSSFAGKLSKREIPRQDSADSGPRPGDEPHPRVIQGENNATGGTVGEEKGHRPSDVPVKRDSDSIASSHETESHENIEPTPKRSRSSIDSIDVDADVPREGNEQNSRFHPTEAVDAMNETDTHDEDTPRYENTQSEKQSPNFHHPQTEDEASPAAVKQSESPPKALEAGEDSDMDMEMDD